MLIFDLETNGLLDDLSCVHCLVIFDTQADQMLVFNDTGAEQPLVRGITMLEEADTIVGHNCIGFDIPAIQKCYPFFTPPNNVIDTLLLSRLYHADLLNIDKQNAWKHMPLQLYGRHSLQAYGYRLGEYKGSFCEHTDWKEWSQEMQDYCVQDVEVTKKLCSHFHPYLTGSKWSTK